MLGYTVAMPTVELPAVWQDNQPMARPPNRIEEFRKRSGLTLDDLAARLQVDTSTIWKLEKGRRRLTADWMERLARELGVAPAELLWQQSAQTPTVRPALDAPAIPSRMEMARDVPVFGTAEGGPDGTFLLQTGNAIDYVRRLPGLMNIRDAFALYVEGESMVPWRQPGQLIFINPHRPARIGDYVVVTLRGETDAEQPAIVKRLVARRNEALVLQQHNPESEIEVPLSRVVRIWRVMELEELIGV